jgi:HAD superfamily hydrolase (TIGR01459 family)
MNNPTPPRLTLAELADRYDALLIDAYGVLIDGSGPIPGAPEAIAALNAREKKWLVLTNDASRYPETSVQKYTRYGLEVSVEQVVTSGSLLAPYFQAHGLVGRRTVCLGPADSHRYAREAGADLVPAGEDAEVLVVGDDAGFPFLETVEAVLSSLFRRLDAGRDVHLILPNPDLIYPKGGGEFGLTAGSIALILEEALAQRYPDREVRFARLGKPFAPIYEAAIALLGTRNVCMVGDQLATDVAGAISVGIDAALVSGGVGRFTEADAVRPTWLLDL